MTQYLADKQKKYGNPNTPLISITVLYYNFCCCFHCGFISVTMLIQGRVKLKTDKGLPGVIKGSGIICSCETCGGKEVSLLIFLVLLN